MKELVLFDSDGVIMDNVDEAIISSYNAYKRLSGQNKNSVYTIEDVPKKIVNGFKKYRPKAFSVVDFLILVKSFYEDLDNKSKLKTTENLSDVIDISEEDANEFKNHLYNFRENEFIPKKELFLKAMKPYEKAVEQYAELMESSDYEVYIVSNRDKKTIAFTLNSNGYPVCEERIFDVNYGGSKQERICKAIQESDIPSTKSHFIDDYVGTLINSKNDSKEAGINLYLAKWGCVNDKAIRTAIENNINVIKQTDIIKAIQRQ